MPEVKLSFVTLVAYDWAYAQKAIAAYQAIADEIIIGVDQDGIGFTGRPIATPSPLPLPDKVRMVAADFHSHGTPCQNDTWERNYLAERCKPGNLVIQIDADEILIGAKQFREWVDTNGPRAYAATWGTVFKLLPDNKALIIYPGNERVQVSSVDRDYKHMRTTGERLYQSPLRLLHYSWGRTRAELETKIRHWSHAYDADWKKYLEFWDSVNLSNYKYIRNFHPFGDGSAWNGLKLVDLTALEAGNAIA